MAVATATTGMSVALGRIKCALYLAVAIGLGILDGFSASSVWLPQFATVAKGAFIAVPVVAGAVQVGVTLMDNR